MKETFTLRREMLDALACVEARQIADESSTLDPRVSESSPLARGPGSVKEGDPAIPSPLPTDAPLTRDQAAEFLRVNVRTLDVWAAKKQIAHFRLGSRVLFMHADLLKFLASRRIEAKGP